MKVLLVEDDQHKAGAILEVVRSSVGDRLEISHKLSLADALLEMRAKQFDLCLLDIVLPKRLGQRPTRDGGMELLRLMNRDSSILRPRYIVGISGFAEVVEEEAGEFAENLWTLVHYSDRVETWKGQIRNISAYIESVCTSGSFSDGVTFGYDAAILCALEDVEFEALQRVDFNWTPIARRHDETQYIEGSIVIGEDTKRVIAAAAPRMGMAASAALACKMISAFRPRVLAMVGICAARESKANLGDIIIASPCWDWGSGKIEEVDGEVCFAPSPHQLDLDIDISAKLRDLARDAPLLASLKQKCAGPKPSSEVSVHIGPLVSGAAVVAAKSTFDELLAQHRKIVGLEMEAYAVHVAAQSMGKPRPKALVMKGVSDFADSDKGDDIQPFAAEISARFLKESLIRVLADD